VLVRVVGWMLDVLVVVRLLLLVVVCVRDDPLVVVWLCSGHHVPSGLCFWTISCWVRAVLAMKQTVESAAAVSVLDLSLWCHYYGLGGIFLTASGFSSWVLVGYVVHLLLTAAVLPGV
jgi:hypothetical protein